MKPTDRHERPAGGTEGSEPETLPVVLCRILRRQLTVMQANLPGIKADLDPEPLHDFRVALRRARALFSQFDKILPSETVNRFRPEFAWLGALTGPLRDLDVHLMSFADQANSLPKEIRADLAPLRELLERLRRQARQELLDELNGARFHDLMRDWGRWLDQPPDRESWGAPAERPVKELADRKIGRLLRRALREGAAITAETPPPNLHELRKTGKKLRYLLEFFQGFYPPRELARLLVRLKGIQDALGVFQDRQVQIRALRQYGEELWSTNTAPAATLLAIGMLLGQLHTEQSRAREAFAERWAGFSRPRNRQMFRKARGNEPEQGPETKPDEGETEMSACLKGKSENKVKKGHFHCERCGAVSKKENHLCKPEELTKKAVKKLAEKKEKSAKG